MTMLNGNERLGTRLFFGFLFLLAAFAGVHWLVTQTSPETAALIVFSAWLLSKVLNFFDRKRGWTAK
jgi:hypothetical protein